MHQFDGKHALNSMSGTRGKCRMPCLHLFVPLVCLSLGTIDWRFHSLHSTEDVPRRQVAALKVGAESSAGASCLGPTGLMLRHVLFIRQKYNKV